ncbi:hypothetical protein JCM10207_004031 [Rhodosporidiobolus poonsookiae]
MLDPADMLCYRFLQGYWEYGIFWRYGWTDGLAFAAEEGFRLTAPLTVYTVTLSWLSSWALIFWRPNKLYWRTVASCFWLEVVNSVCMLVVDTSDHWFTEIVSLNPLLKRCLGKAVHKVLHAIVLRYSLLVEVLAFPLGCCMFVVLFACGVFLCLFATALVVGTWSLIYYELALTFQSPRQMCKATPPKPQRTSSSSHEVSIFSNALKSLASTLDELRFDCNTSIRVVHAYLELEPAQSRAVEAEHQSHQAILDAVLDWKAQKLELERSEWRIKLA